MLCPAYFSFFLLSESGIFTFIMVKLTLNHCHWDLWDTLKVFNFIPGHITSPYPQRIVECQLIWWFHPWVPLNEPYWVEGKLYWHKGIFYTHKTSVFSGLWAKSKFISVKSHECCGISNNQQLKCIFFSITCLENLKSMTYWTKGQ